MVWAKTQKQENLELILKIENAVMKKFKKSFSLQIPIFSPFSHPFISRYELIL